MDLEARPKAPGWRDIHTVSARRSLFLMACGALVGLTCAGYALFTAKGTSTLLVPPEDVAIVNQQPLSRSDYLIQLQTLFNVDFAHSTSAERQRVLDDMIREELFVQRAKELDLAESDPDVRSAMVAAVEQEIAADAITTQPREDQLRAYYTANKPRYSSEGTITIRDFVFPANPATVAYQAATALRDKIDPERVLAQFGGRDTGRTRNEEFYFAAKIHLGDRDFAVARSLSAGDVTSPLSEADGAHVLLVLQNKPPVPMTFDEARAQALTDYRDDAIRRLRSGDELFFRKRANILIASDLKP